MSDSRQHQPGQPGQPYAQPGQPYAQPGQLYAQPGQLYAQPGQPYSQSAQSGQPQGSPLPPFGQAPAVTPVSGAALGRLAFLVTVFSVGLGLLLQLFMPFLYATVGTGGSDVLPSAVNFIVFAGAAAGLVLALVAVRRQGPPLLAAIAIGVAATTVLGTLASGLSSVFYNFGF